MFSRRAALLIPKGGSARSITVSKGPKGSSGGSNIGVATALGIGLGLGGGYVLSEFGSVQAADRRSYSYIPPPPSESSSQPDLEKVKSRATSGVILLGGLLVLGTGAWCLSRLKRVPPNQVLVIYGKTMARSADNSNFRASRCVHGGGAFVWPIIQDYAYLNLEPLQIDINLKGALSLEKIRVNMPSVFTVAISSEEQYMANAAVRLLGLDVEDIHHQAGEIIYGHLREVIASMEIEQINRDFPLFKSRVSESLEVPLRSLGLELMNVNFKDLTDDSGFIEAIGKKAATEARQKARVDVAERIRMGTVGEKQAQQEEAIQMSELEKNQEVTIAANQYSQEAQVKDQERTMRISIAKANAEAVTGENQSRALIEESNSLLKIREAEAYRQGEIKKREAEQAVREAESVASAKAAIAYAKQIEEEKRAALVSPALAAKATRIVQAEADAEQAKIEADARAHAIFAVKEAEARGEFEGLSKKAEGLKMIVGACGGSKEAVQIMMLEHVDTLAQTTAQAISNIKFDKVVVWDGGSSDGNSGATANFIKSVAQSLPPALSIMKDVAGVSMPEMLGKLEDDIKVAEQVEKEKNSRQ